MATRLLHLLVGHQNEVKNLINAFAEKRLHSTLLFVGPTGIGKKQVAFALSQTLLCRDNKETFPEPCGRCADCLRVATLKHESMLVIEPQKNMIKIDQSREVLDFLSLKALGQKRIVVIDQAQYMNPQAANALLKILEEPPEGTHFFLIAPAAQGMMQTIRSRSQIVRFRPLSVDEMKKKYKLPEWVFRASQGSFQNLQMLNEEEEQTVRAKAAHHLFELGRDSRLFLKDSWREIIRDRMEAINIARYWSSFLRDAFIKKAGGEDVINVDQVDLIHHLSSLDASVLSAVSEAVLQLEPALMANRDPQLVFEDFWIRAHRLPGVQ
ncbi:MAG: ATP-binding protein [Pseudobdellovibrionaceae bacterium]